MISMTQHADDPVAAFIQRCTDQLQHQAAACRGWPNPLRLPLPQNDAEREALELWFREVRQQTGAAIRIVHAD
jgi:hypothetical protein